MNKLPTELKLDLLEQTALSSPTGLLSALRLARVNRSFLAVFKAHHVALIQAIVSPLTAVEFSFLLTLATAPRSAADVYTREIFVLARPWEWTDITTGIPSRLLGAGSNPKLVLLALGLAKHLVDIKTHVIPADYADRIREFQLKEPKETDTNPGLLVFLLYLLRGELHTIPERQARRPQEQRTVLDRVYAQYDPLARAWVDEIEAEFEREGWEVGKWKHVREETAMPGSGETWRVWTDQAIKTEYNEVRVWLRAARTDWDVDRLVWFLDVERCENCREFHWWTYSSFLATSEGMDEIT